MTKRCQELGERTPTSRKEEFLRLYAHHITQAVGKHNLWLIGMLNVASAALELEAGVLSGPEFERILKQNADTVEAHYEQKQSHRDRKCKNCIPPPPRTIEEVMLKSAPKQAEQTLKVEVQERHAAELKEAAEKVQEVTSTEPLVENPLEKAFPTGRYPRFAYVDKNNNISAVPPRWLTDPDGTQ